MSGAGSGPTASVIIRCLNESKHIGTLLRALSTQTVDDFEIIVVDSGSTDGTQRIVERHAGARLLHIAPEDFSFGRSLNLGCLNAKGAILVSISAHCWPEGDHWLERLIEWFDHPDIAAVYGRQRGHPTTHFSEHRIFEKWYPDHSTLRQDGPFSNNANCAVRRELWERHPYAEDLPGLEDVAWAREVMKAGYRIAYRADAGVIHVHDETRKQTRTRYRREAIALRRLFPEESFSLFDFLRLYPSNVLSDLRLAARQQVLLDEAWQIVSFRFAQFWGAYEGFRTRWPGSSALKRHLYYPEHP